MRLSTHVRRTHLPRYVSITHLYSLSLPLSLSVCLSVSLHSSLILLFAQSQLAYSLQILGYNIIVNFYFLLYRPLTLLSINSFFKCKARACSALWILCMSYTGCVQGG